jgi:hypothetical protein
VGAADLDDARLLGPRAAVVVEVLALAQPAAARPPAHVPVAARVGVYGSHDHQADRVDEREEGLAARGGEQIFVQEVARGGLPRLEHHAERARLRDGEGGLGAEHRGEAGGDRELMHAGGIVARDDGLVPAGVDSTAP